jgi:PAS domain S-box-containing protein/diguanylate cyclase (GGDEF)-like protein
MERRDAFAADVMHELKTPLSIVLGLTGRMLETPGLLPATRRDAERVRANALMAVKHVDDMLQAARLDTTAIELHVRPVDLASVARRVVAAFEGLAQERAIRLVVEAAVPVLARVDDDKVATVISNLVANALKFTPGGGSVRVGVSTSDRVLITVADSGPGVPEHLRERVFDRFRQGDGRHTAGSGLGLAIVRELVALHEGAIAIENAPEGGALFVVTLPVSPVDPDELEQGDMLDLGPREQPTLELLRSQLAIADLREAALRASLSDEASGLPEVLVVEDNADLSAFLTELLSPLYRVRLAVDGAQALELIERRIPELILTDLMMPGMSGAELVSAVRARAELDDVPIVVLSVRSDEGLRLRLLHEGVQDYVLKPFAAEELLARIGNLVSRRHAEFARQRAEGRFRGAFDNAPIGMALATLDGVYVKVNRALCAITGYTESELVGRRISDITHPDDVERHADAVRAVVSEQSGANQIEHRYLCADGSVAWAAVSTSLLPEQGGVPHLIVQVEDITERRRLESELNRLVDRDAEQDPLTGVLSQPSFFELLSAQVERCQRYHETAALYRVALLNLGELEELHGRGAAEELLVAVAGALRTRVRGSDVIGRLDCDEFAVLAVHVRGTGAEVMRRSIAETLAEVEVAVDMRFAPRTANVRATCTVLRTLVDGSVGAETLLASAGPQSVSLRVPS